MKMKCKEKVTKEFKFTLTEEEARDLFIFSSKIGGSSGVRQTMDDIYDDLKEHFSPDDHKKYTWAYCFGGKKIIDETIGLRLK